MTRFHRSVRTLSLLAGIMVFAPAAFAAENAWSVELLNSRKAEWEKLVGPAIRIEGRIHLQGKGQMRLVKCDLVFYVNEAQLRSLNGQRSVEFSGRFKKSEGKVTFEVGQILALPSDIEQLESRIAKLRNPRPTEWYELGEWAAGRARFYEDAELTKKAVAAFTNGVKIEWHGLPAVDGESRIRLARKAGEYKLPDDQRMELLHEGYRLLWQASLKADKPDSETWQQLATRMAADLPGSSLPLPAFPAELKRRYEREPLTVYRESPEDTRRQLHRLFYASVVLKPIEAEATVDGQNGNVIANRIERAVPEEEGLAEKYRAAKLAWRLDHAATATRQEVVQLANDYRSRQLPVFARQALQSWLHVREDRQREDGSLGLLQLAEDYLSLLQDETKAVALLREAYQLDPSFEDVARRLESLGYTLDRGAWAREKAVKPASDHSTADGNSTGGISVGMTESALRKLLPARPESIARAITSTSVIEVWSYGPIGTSPLTIRLERAGRSEAKVVEIGNGQ